jgi:hypothetical protein
MANLDHHQSMFPVRVGVRGVLSMDTSRGKRCHYNWLVHGCKGTILVVVITVMRSKKYGKFDENSTQRDGGK